MSNTMRASRRQFLLCVSTLAYSKVAFPQNTVRRIGLLWVSGPDAAVYVDALIDGLRSQGYVDGKNIQIDKRSLVARYDQLKEAAARLTKERVDVIVTYGTTSSQAAIRATSSIPIVFSVGADPTKFGLVESFSRPGRNATGISILNSDTNGKRMDLLKELVPRMRTAAVLFSGDSPHEFTGVKVIQDILRSIGVDSAAIDIRTPADIDSAIISGLGRRPPDALYVVAGTMFIANGKQLVQAIERLRIPAMYGSTVLAEAGGLIAYSANQKELFRRLATVIDRILKGAKPQDIPVEQASEFELVINVSSAEVQGITVPESLIRRADRLIR